MAGELEMSVVLSAWGVAGRAEALLVRVGREWGDGGTGSSAGGGVVRAGIAGGGANVSWGLAVGSARRSTPVSVTSAAGGLSRVPLSPQKSTSQGLSFKIAFASLALSSLKRPEPLEPVSAERLRWGERPRDCATGVGSLREAVDGPGADAGGGIQDSSELASDGRGE